MRESRSASAETAEVLSDEDLGGGLSRELQSLARSHRLTNRLADTARVLGVVLLAFEVGAVIAAIWSGRAIDSADLIMGLTGSMLLWGIGMVLRSATRSASIGHLAHALAPHLHASGLREVRWHSQDGPLGFTALKEGDLRTFRLAAPVAIPTPRRAGREESANAVEIGAQSPSQRDASDFS